MPHRAGRTTAATDAQRRKHQRGVRFQLAKKMTSARISSHFAELLDVLPDVLAWVKDRQGRYVWVNRAFLVQYSLDHQSGNEGVSIESILGKTDYDLSPAFLADQFRLDDEHAPAGNPIVNRIERREGVEGAAGWQVS